VTLPYHARLQSRAPLPLGSRLAPLIIVLWSLMTWGSFKTIVSPDTEPFTLLIMIPACRNCPLRRPIASSVDSRTEVSHTHVEWLRFLKQIDRDTPPDLELHLIADNYATHKHPKVRAWLEKHPRFKMHFTPTSSSWLNLVERFFADLTGDVIRAGHGVRLNSGALLLVAGACLAWVSITITAVYEEAA
jgi:hypothetical protein